jgi:hypothetical protein
MVKTAPPKFVKKLDEIRKILVHSSLVCPFSLQLAENGLIGQFIGIWPSPRAMAQWLDLNWKKISKGKCPRHSMVRVFFLFLFENKEDRDLTFRNGSYFMGSRGMYMNKWTLDFIPKK